MTIIKFFKTIGIVLAWSFYTTAQASDTIELVVPFPPGGTVDIVARAVQQEISRQSTIKTVVVNKPGADGIIASQYFSSSPGNKILMTSTGTSLFLKLLNPQAGFDPINDFAIQGPIATASTVLVVSEKSGISNLDEFVRQAKQRTLNCGTSNAMAVFFGNYVANSQGLKLNLIPYKGSAMVLSDITGGHIDCAIDVAPVYIGKTGMNVIAVSTKDLSQNFNVPTLAKAEYKFENFYAMAFGQDFDVIARRQIQNIVSLLHRDSNFVKSMAAKGIVVNTRFENDLRPKLNLDYNYLQTLDQRLQIIKK
jgi:tripartite-type tricarboxylate transporter receptor subunit TctC